MNSLFQVESEDLFKKAVNEIIDRLFTNNYHNYDLEIQKAKEEFRDVLSHNDFNMENISKDIQNKNWDEARVKYFLKRLSDKKSNLLDSMLHYHNSSQGAVVTNFDWNIKLILGTNELKSIKYPVLQLLLAVYFNEEHQKMACDVGPGTLTKLINVLETALQ